VLEKQEQQQRLQQQKLIADAGVLGKQDQEQEQRKQQ
jgi:hypothetical protein